jgi:hypothetical protein
MNLSYTQDRREGHEFLVIIGPLTDTDRTDPGSIGHAKIME